MRLAKLKNPVRQWKGKHISVKNNMAFQEGKKRKARALQMIGFAKDNITILERAIEYLKKYKDL